MSDMIVRTPVLAAPLAEGYPISNYLRLLPRIFRDGLSEAKRPQDAPLLCRFLTAFEWVFEGFEQRQDDIDQYFDAATCSTRFLPWLLSWFGFDLDVDLTTLDEVRQRRLLREAHKLNAQRGTRAGLIRLIEIVTDLTPEIRISNQPHCFDIVLNAPKGNPLDMGLIAAWIDAYKPAHVVYTLAVRP